MKNFAMLGKWHVHAEGYAKELASLPGCRVTKVWDKDEAQAAAWAQALNCQSTTVEDILNDPEIEGVVVCCATNEHTPLILRACRAGKAVFTEKVLALTSREADEIQAAVAQSNTRFAISFPHLSEPATQFSLATALSGKLGQLNYARVRKAHNGSTADWLPPHFYDPIACGGGAMIDLGAHPMYLLCALLGQPVSIQSTFTEMTGRGVEDNAVSLLRFENGAIGVSETSFVSSHYPFTIEIGGTEGSLLQRDQEVTYCCPETGNQWRSPDELPAPLPSPLVQWAQANTPGEIPQGFGIDAARRLTRVMEMAYAAE